jgi:glutathione peroxidase-family protein
MHDFEMDAITGEPVPLSTYAGSVCLVVNVASR